MKAIYPFTWFLLILFSIMIYFFWTVEKSCQNFIRINFFLYFEIFLSQIYTSTRTSTQMKYYFGNPTTFCFISIDICYNNILVLVLVCTNMIEKPQNWKAVFNFSHGLFSFLNTHAIINKIIRKRTIHHNPK